LLDLTLLVVIILDKVIQVIVIYSFQIKGMFEIISDIVSLAKIYQKSLQEEKFFIIFVLLERKDRNSIVQLHSETVDSVVDKDHVFHADILEYTKVLDVDILSGLDTRVSI